MAIPAIGNIECPHCGFSGAEVKETKKLLAMIYCDGCDQQTFARSKKSDMAIRAKMKPLTTETVPVVEVKKSFLESL
jgi:hypothetical protein